MKKVLGAMAGILFSLFCIAILGLLMSFTYQALKILFPNSPTNQLWGLLLFDVSAMIWALVFVFKSASVGQYAVAGLGFVTGFLGTLLMVSAEVILSGQTFVQNNDIGRFMVYGFIAVTVIHAALVYAHHAFAPDIHERINVGIAQGEISTEAIRQATNSLEQEKSQLASILHGDIVNRVKRDLNIPVAVDPSIGFVPAQQYTQAPYPVEQPQPKSQGSLWDSIKGNLPWTRKPAGMNINEQTVVQTTELKPETKPEEPPAGDAPFPGPKE